MVDKELIRLYLDTMSLNEHLTQWYRAVFIAFQVGVTYTMLTIRESTNSDKLMLLLLGFGLLVSVLWVWLTNHRANIVQRQKKKILEKLNDGADNDLKDCFEIYKSEFGRWLPVITFNYFLPICAGILLILIFKFSNCTTISCCCSAWVATTFLALSIFVGWKCSHWGLPSDEQQKSAR